jgi:hypothetical protein
MLGFEPKLLGKIWQQFCQGTFVALPLSLLENILYIAVWAKKANLSLAKNWHLC